MPTFKYLDRQWYRNAYRRVTGIARPLPNTLIIGAMKAGTTSLFNYLATHPRVTGSYIKELNYFNHNWDKRLGWYCSAFPISGHWAEVVMEATTDYLYHPFTPERVKQTLADPKLIVLLRNPVHRAYSHYQHEVRQGREMLSFQEALEQEEGRTGATREKYFTDPTYQGIGKLHYNYKERGVYADQLERWFRYFDRDQFFIQSSSYFWADTAAFMKDLGTFLEVDLSGIQTGRKYNENTYPNLDEKTRDYLSEYYREPNQRLFKLLDRSFDW
ncbi:MAG: sulfotransferase domain-containing protein [Bacteroidota bacterium]